MTKKDRGRFVYSTNPDYSYDDDSVDEETLPPEDQNLKVFLETKGRKGKVVTLIDGFVGQAEDLKDLEKSLKTKCGVGGSSKDGQIILQGSVVQKAVGLLQELGYHTHNK